MHLRPHELRGYLPDLELQVFGVDAPEQVQKASDQTGPPCLVAGAKPRSIVTVALLEEENQITPVRIVLELGRATVDRPLSCLPS